MPINNIVHGFEKNESSLVIKLCFCYFLAVGVVGVIIKKVAAAAFHIDGNVGAHIVVPFHLTPVWVEFLLALDVMPEDNNIAFADGSTIGVFETCLPAFLHEVRNRMKVSSSNMDFSIVKRRIMPFRRFIPAFGQSI
jgi:hypothetical protein